jgi:hypothetical protein
MDELSGKVEDYYYNCYYVNGGDTYNDYRTKPGDLGREKCNVTDKLGARKISGTRRARNNFVSTKLVCFAENGYFLYTCIRQVVCGI